MNIVVAGAGQVGRTAAEELAADGHSVTVIETSPAVLKSLEETFDVGIIQGNCVHADVLQEAGAAGCDQYIAATNVDEINLLSASIAKAIGARRSLARVHHSAYFAHRGLHYDKYLHIDHLICPEFLTSLAIAQKLRNPGAMAIESFARGMIEMQEFAVSANAAAVNTPLAGLKLPRGVRLAIVRRDGRQFIPDGSSVMQPNDVVTLIGETSTFDAARKLFQSEKRTRKHVVIMGGTPMGVWLCRALKGPDFSVRLFVNDRARAEELASKLDHVTVVDADPSDPTVFEEERLSTVDVFIALTHDDEHNLLAAAQAKNFGVRTAVTVVERTTYLTLLANVGIDFAFSPRRVAVKEIQRMLDAGPVRSLAVLAEGHANVYEIRPGPGGKVVGRALRECRFPSQCIVAAIQRGDRVRVPGAEDIIQPDDTVLAIGPCGLEKELRQLFLGK